MPLAERDLRRGQRLAARRCDADDDNNKKRSACQLTSLLQVLQVLHLPQIFRQVELRKLPAQAAENELGPKVQVRTGSSEHTSLEMGSK